MATTTTDPAPNGAVSPPVPEPLSPPDNKRKRETDAESQPAVAQGLNVSVRSKQTQRDVLEILQQYDTSPSFLEHPLGDESSAGGPSQKKARLSNGTHGETTVSSKLSNGAYASLDGLKEDATRVCEALETSLRAKAREGGAPNPGRLSVEELKRIQRAKAFARLIEDVVDKEREYSSANDEQGDQKNTGIKVNGHSGDAVTGPDQKLGTVLTLFGNAPTPKQLFSSLQHAPAGRQETAIKSELPVEEMSLPNGLTATKIMPPTKDDFKKGPTFEEAFPPPYNLPSLHAPKAHKRSSTRDMTLKWESKDTVNRSSSKKGGYTVQGLTTGDWLGYGGVDPVQTASSKEKRKQRERALSSGERVKEPPSQATREEQRVKDEEALFRRAYGSFAPSIDNSKSVVPAQTKSAVWWEKVGERRFNETFAIDPALVEGPSAEEVNVRSILPEHSDIPENFESVIEELDKMEESPVEAEAAASKTDVEMVLREVAELLETLASHQRIRNASLPSSHQASSRNPLSPAPVLASRIGKPDEPAEAEISTYHALRRELAYLILKLPPYAVAKIDGDQLAELGVNKLIPFETKDYKGTMEEDQVARLAKYNAMATAAGIATLTRGNSASGQHYNTTGPQRTPAIGQAANTRYGQTSQYGAARTPATQPQFQRSTSNQSYSTPTATAPRPTYAQQPAQYPRQGAPQQTYGQPNGQPQYYQQRPPTQTGGYGGGYNQQYSQTPQTQPRPAYSSSQPLAQFQARSHAAAANAVAYQANSGTPGPYNHTASPATAPPKPSYAQAPQQPGSIQPRPPVYQQAPPPQPGQYAQASGSGRATPSFPPSQPGTPVNGYQARPPQPPPMQPGVGRAASGTPQPAAQGQGQGFVQPQP